MSGSRSAESFRLSESGPGIPGTTLGLQGRRWDAGTDISDAEIGCFLGDAGVRGIDVTKWYEYI